MRAYTVASVVREISRRDAGLGGLARDLRSANLAKPNLNDAKGDEADIPYIPLPIVL